MVNGLDPGVSVIIVWHDCPGEGTRIYRVMTSNRLSKVTNLHPDDHAKQIIISIKLVLSNSYYTERTEKALAKMVLCELI